MTVTITRSIPGDLLGIRRLLTSNGQHAQDPAKMLEHGLLCLSAKEDATHQIIGYLCVNHGPYVMNNPSGALSDEQQDWLDNLIFREHFVSINTAFVTTTIAHPEFEAEAMPAMLKTAFKSILGLKNLLALRSGPMNALLKTPEAAHHFGTVEQEGAGGLALYRCTRHSLMSVHVVRRARVEDHDELVPLLAAGQAACPSLATLPETCLPDQPFALTRLISSQDDNHVMLVAEEESPTGVSEGILGFLSARADLDASALHALFDTQTFDGFLRPQAYDELWRAARDELIAERTVPPPADDIGEASGEGDAAAAATPEAAAAAGGSERGSRPASGIAATGSEPLAPTPSGGGGAAGSEGEHPGLHARFSGEALEEHDAEAHPSRHSHTFGRGPKPFSGYLPQAPAAVHVDVEEIHALVQQRLVERSASEPNALLTLSLMCFNEELHYEAHRMVAAIFDLFPDKDYLLVGLQHGEAAPAWLDKFGQLAPLPGREAPQVIYVVNRHALRFDEFHVRRARPEDMKDVRRLVHDLPNAASIQASFFRALIQGGSYVATVHDHLVGLMTVTGEVDLACLAANFNLGQLSHMTHYEEGQLGEVGMFHMNPIFRHMCGTFLLRTMQLARRHCLFYALPAGQQPPELLHEFCTVPQRHDLAPDSEEDAAEYALYAFTRKLGMRRKTVINARVVVVGPSETSLATLETLILQEDLSFNNLYLLAPGGIPLTGPACLYTPHALTRFALEANVKILDASMVALDRASKTIALSDGGLLAYDYLVIGTGLQDQLKPALIAANPEAAPALRTAAIKAQDFLAGGDNVEELINTFVASAGDVVVYGESLEAYSVLAALQDAGVPPERIKFLAPQQGPLTRVLNAMALNLGSPLSLEVQSVAPAAKPKGALLLRCRDPALLTTQEVVCSLLITASVPTISKKTFACLNDACLVFDGMLVVDATFATNDPAIFAAGTAAKLSRSYDNAHLLLAHYNSREVGQQLGECLAERLRRHYGALPPEPAAGSAKLPTLRIGKVVGCTVPGGNHFLFAGCPRAFLHPSVNPPHGGRQIFSQTKDSYLQINMDNQLVVHSVMYYGSKAPPAYKLSALIGLASTFLNPVLSELKASGSCDLMAWLDKPETQLLFHDGFSEVRNQLLSRVSRAGSQQEAFATVQGAVMDFLRAHAGELAAFNAAVQAPTATA